MVDQNLQNRGGNNAGPGPIMFFDGMKGAANLLKIVSGQDNVLIEGQANTVRVTGITDLFIGLIFNRTGDAGTDLIGDVIFIDAQGNELILVDDLTIADDNAGFVPSLNDAWGPFGLQEDEKIVFRLDAASTNPAQGQGVYFLPLTTNDSDTARAARAYITDQTRTIIAQPPAGKVWQMPITTAYPCGASILAINFDTVNAKAFDCYLVNGDTGDEVLLSDADAAAAEDVSNIFSDVISSHMVPYPYRLEVEEVSGNPFAEALLIASLFIEFDLPKDLG